ncbi:MAG: HAD-IIB family hydrolase [Pseudomonadota bacterium]
MLDNLKGVCSNCLVFFTDLDGTLLDHQTYSFDPASEALDMLRKRNIPLVLASSKTAAEIFPLRRAMGFQHCPAIVENGAGILSANDPCTGSDASYRALLERFSNLPVEIQEKFTGFSRLGLDDVIKLTGLAEDQAILAKQRQFSEPGLWSGGEDELPVFFELLKEHGMAAQRGGRFLTLSFGGNKVDQMQKISQEYSRDGRSCFCVALGDAPNDVKMIEAADVGVIIPNSSHSGIDRLKSELDGKTVRAPYPGPRGWNATVLDLLAMVHQGG